MSEPAALQKIDIAGYHWRHRESIIPAYPLSVQKALQAEYIETAGPVRTYPDGPGPGKFDSWARANRQLTNRDKQLRAAHSHIAFSEHDIEVKARHYVWRCKFAGTLEGMHEVARFAGIVPPSDKFEEQGQVKRLLDAKWWRAQMRKHYSRAAEGQLREMGLVHRRAGLYVSNATVRRFKEKKRGSREMMRHVKATNDLGDEFTLLELAESSQSNPALRRAELMTRMRGFGELADLAGHAAEFYTFSTPSRFHAQMYAGGKNPKYEKGLSPREAQAWLCKMWSMMRTKLGNLSIYTYGFRVVEPHHDGTPHWHLILFMKPHQRETVRRVCRDYLLSDQGNEPGAQKHRFKVEPIDHRKGSAAGYIAKYIAKNIDGFEVGADFEQPESDAKNTCLRVAAWSSTWGIRQFQQIGGPTVGLWRELRRIREPVDDATMETARAAADSGEWQKFVDALGGIHARRKDLPLRLEKEITGEINQYDELKAAAVVGVAHGVFVVLTRLRIWVFAFSPVQGPWTRVNNCTQGTALNFGSDHEKTGPPIEKEFF